MKQLHKLLSTVERDHATARDNVDKLQDMLREAITRRDTLREMRDEIKDTIRNIDESAEADKAKEAQNKYPVFYYATSVDGARTLIIVPDATTDTGSRIAEIIPNGPSTSR